LEPVAVIRTSFVPAVLLSELGVPVSTPAVLSESPIGSVYPEATVQVIDAASVIAAKVTDEIADPRANVPRLVAVEIPGEIRTR
jgi:hypothetical protein